MPDPIEPIFHKMTEAIPEPRQSLENDIDETRDHDRVETDIKQHNAQVQPQPKDRLVDIGRGQNTKGRGGHG